MRLIMTTEKLGAALVVASLGLMPACSTATTSRELVDARQAYSAARNSDAARLKPDELVDARQALKAAEAAHEDDPGGVEEQHLAYLAERRAQLAMSRGKRASMEKQYAEKNKMLVDQARSYAMAAKQQIEQQSGQIQMTKKELMEERKARKEAEQLAAKALQDLKDVAMVREESRGYVITLSGSVLFRTGKADLLQTAQDRLQQVASALKQQHENSDIVVEGHTDSRGSDSYNQQLSLERAQSVRQFLVTQGIAEARIEAKGMGESQPVASNSTPEGRANNRRVEIVVKPSTNPGTPSATGTTSGAGTGGQQQPQPTTD